MEYDPSGYSRLEALDSGQYDRQLGSDGSPDPWTLVGTLAGNGRPGNRDGDVRKSLFDQPSEICSLPDGSLLVADIRNNTLRHVNLGGGGTRNSVSTVDAAPFLGPRSPCLMDDGSGVLVCDSGHHKIRLLRFLPLSDRDEASSAPRQRRSRGRTHPLRSRSVHRARFSAEDAVIAGNGRAGHVDGPAEIASFRDPTGLCMASDGSVLVCDSGNNSVRQVYSRVGSKGLRVATVAGGSTLQRRPQAGWRDGPAHEAQFNKPTSIVTDVYGTIWVSDTGNHCLRALRPVLAGHGAEEDAALWHVSTVAGNPQSPGFEDGSADACRFRHPTGLCLGPSGGSLFLCDSGNHCIRELTILPGGIVESVRTVFGLSPDRVRAARLEKHGVQPSSSTSAGAATAGASASPKRLRFVAGGPREAEPSEESQFRGVPGYRDGLVEESRFAVPRAALFLRQPSAAGAADNVGGLVVIADSGNHLLRVIARRSVAVRLPYGIQYAFPSKNSHRPEETTASPRRGVSEELKHYRSPGRFQHQVLSPSRQRVGSRGKSDQKRPVSGRGRGGREAAGSKPAKNRGVLGEAPRPRKRGPPSPLPKPGQVWAALRQTEPLPRVTADGDWTRDGDHDEDMPGVRGHVGAPYGDHSRQGGGGMAVSWDDGFRNAHPPRSAVRFADEVDPSPFAAGLDGDMSDGLPVAAGVPSSLASRSRQPATTNSTANHSGLKAASSLRASAVPSYMTQTASSVSRAQAKGVGVPKEDVTPLWRVQHRKLASYVDQ